MHGRTARPEKVQALFRYAALAARSTPLGEPHVVHVLFLDAEAVREFVAERDADLLDQILAVLRGALEVALEQVDRVGPRLRHVELARRGQRHAVEQAE